MTNNNFKWIFVFALWTSVCLVPECFPIGNNLVFAQSLINVPQGGDLQKAIDQAQPGDTITLVPGATYMGHFRLRKKAGDAFITITTATPETLPAPNTRISPAAAPSLPKITSPDTSAVIKADDGAHHYRLVGLEIHSLPNYYISELIELGSATAVSLSELPTDIELDRLYLHGSPSRGGKRAVILNGIAIIVKNCYISDMKSTDQDSQALVGWNGPGPFQIINNYLEASGENILFGGATASIDGLVPSDILIRQNYFYKPASWFRGSGSFTGTTWMVKNLLELKAARRVTIEGNIFEHCWGQAQAGYAIVFTVRAVRATMPWVVVEDVNFTHNIVRNSSGGVNILGIDYNSGDIGIARRIVVRDNLFENIDYTVWGGEGRLFQVLQGAEDVTIDHNTSVKGQLRHLIMLEGVPLVRFSYTNNISQNSTVLGSGKGAGTASLNYYAPGYTFRKNALTGGNASTFPAGNFFPATINDIGFTNFTAGDYRLTSESPYKNVATDDRDLGADIAAIRALTGGVDHAATPAGNPPMTESITPASGEGIIQTFQASYSDGDGYQNIDTAYLLVGRGTSLANACYIRYGREDNSLWLMDSANSAWQGPAIVGTPGNLENSQCMVDAGTAEVSGSDNTLSLKLPLTFQSTFLGTKTLSLNVEDKDGQASGWKNHGTWTTGHNGDPVVTITSPSNDATVSCPASVTFQGTVSDPEGEELTPAWTDNGTSIGSGASVTRSFTCAQTGLHTVTATATDSNGAVASQSLQIKVRNEAAIVNITSPANGTAFTCPVSVTFQANAADADGAAIQPVWTDNGSDMGIGNAVTKSYTCADLGTHNIIATATPGQGTVGSASVAISIREPLPNRPPVVTITSPTNNAAFTCPATVTLRATVTDPDGDPVVPIWTDNGTPIGTGTTITHAYACGEAGTHSIIATATDGKEASGNASVAIAVRTTRVPNTPVLTATVAGAKVTLSWTHDGVNVTSFVVKRRRTSGLLTSWAAIPGTITPAMRGVTDSPGKASYEYYIYAVNGTLSSPLSNVVKVTVK